MTTGQNYFLYSSDNDKKYHPYHWSGTQELNEALKNTADEYRKACPTAGKMEIGDMSLPWGGLYDFKLDWKNGHKEHRTGLNADIRKKTIRKSNRAKFIEIACKKFNVGSEGDEKNEEPHYHFKVKTAAATDEDVFSPDETDPKFIPCCTTPVPNACIILQHNATDYAEYLPETPSDCK